MDFSVPQQYRICTFQYRDGTRASFRLVPKFRNCTLCNGGVPRHWRRTHWKLQSSVPLNAAVQKLYSAKRGNRGTAEAQIGNSSHQHTRATAAAPNKQLRNRDLCWPVVPPFTRQAIRNALRLMEARLIFGFYQTKIFGLFLYALGYKSSL